jgi:xyloglucan-specific exo-beta-1,4-glucanase
MKPQRPVRSRLKICLGIFSASVLFSAARPARAATDEWRQVNLQGMGYVTNLVRAPTSVTTLYARTDVGGIYAFDSGTQSWKPLLGTHRFKSGNPNRQATVESLAVSPEAWGHLYVVVGTSSLLTSAADGTLMESTDGGVTWTDRPITFSGLSRNVMVNGNAPYRGGGERLAIHPTQTAKLIYGTRSDGLIYSRDGGDSWSRVPLTVVPAGTAGIGVTFTAFGKDAKGTVVAYAGVAGQGIYRSTSSFDRWEKIPGTQIPAGSYFFRGVTDKQGALYATSISTDRKTGAVLRWSGSKLTTWRPLGTTMGYSSLAVSPDGKRIALRNPQGGENGFAVSQDAGTTWKIIAFSQAKMKNPIPWFADYLYLWDGNYNGGLEWDASSTTFGLWYSNGSGVFHHANPFLATAQWTPIMQNLEELVINVVHPVKSSAVKLIVGAWDIMGFALPSLTQVPSQGIMLDATKQTAFGRILSVAGSQTVPEQIVFAGSNQDTNESTLTGILRLSKDGGLTWKDIPKPNAKAVEGNVAISASGNSIVWLARTIGSSGGGSAMQLFQTGDEGKSWTEIRGLTGPAGEFRPASLLGGATFLAADPKQNLVFYAYQCGEENQWAPTFYRSDDGGRNFHKTTVGGLRCGNQVDLKAAPGRAGDVWFANQESADKLYRSVDGTNSFVAMPGIDVAYRVGFGKGKTDTAPPAVYVFGVVKGQLGLYRSDNAVGLAPGSASATWVSVSTTPVPFNLVKSLEGDPTLYGRTYLGIGGHGVYYHD